MSSLSQHTQERTNGGQALMVSVIFFLFISLVIITGISTPVIQLLRDSSNSVYSKETYILAESGIEDVVYRLKNGFAVDASEVITLNGNSTTVSTQDLGGDKKGVMSSGVRSNLNRNAYAELSTGVGIAFHYGVQAGTGGFHIEDHVFVDGNVYANGPITSENDDVTITGSATAANSGMVIADQKNGINADGTTVLPVNQTITFRNTDPPQDFSQSFKTASTAPLLSVRFYMKKVGDPPRPSLKITTNAAGDIPDKNNVLVQEQYIVTDKDFIPTSGYGWIEVVFDSNPVLTAGTKYWMVLDADGDNTSNYYVLAANNDGYSDGEVKVGKLSNSTWAAPIPSTDDSYFTVYLGTGLSYIQAAQINKDLEVGTSTASLSDAWAHAISGVKVARDLYCQSGFDKYDNHDWDGASKQCDMSQSDPPQASFPISDAQISQWKADAEAGGVISGNYTVTTAVTLAGPRKITGNLVVEGQNANLTLKGTVWVQGSITVQNKGEIHLDSATYGQTSGVLLSDSWIDIQDHAVVLGTGQTGSYLLILSTSSCTAATCSGHNAIEAKNQADVEVLNAQNGTVELQDHLDIKEATGKRIVILNQTDLIYETGLANVDFSTGPSGGYSISSWKEVE